MDITTIVSTIKDLCLAGAAVITALVAYRGLEKWQTELRGKANFDIARELIKSVYKLRDELSYCRSPFISASEFPEGYQGILGKYSNEEKGQALAHVYSKRWEPVANAAQSFDAAILEAEALWGISIKNKANELRQCIRTLHVHIESYIRNEYSGGEHFHADEEYMKSVKDSIWDTKSKENQLTQKITAAIEKIESEIRPHLSRHSE